jgi:hypothetical protein
MEGDQTVVSGYIECMHAPRSNRVVRMANVRGDIASAWPAEGSSLGIIQPTLAAQLQFLKEQHSPTSTISCPFTIEPCPSSTEAIKYPSELGIKARERRHIRDQRRTDEILWKVCYCRCIRSSVQQRRSEQATSAANTAVLANITVSLRLKDVSLFVSHCTQASVL